MHILRLSDLMCDALVALFHGGALPLPCHNPPKSPDHKQQLFPGHLTSQKEDKALEQALTDASFVIVLYTQCAACYTVYNSIAGLCCWTDAAACWVSNNYLLTGSICAFICTHNQRTKALRTAYNEPK